MNFRSKLMLCSALTGIVMLFVGVALVIGISHRQPASVTLANTACQMMAADVASPAGNGLCRVVADDFQHNGQLVEMWLASRAGEVFEGKTIVLPVGTVKLAVELPRRPVPLWIHSIFYSGIILFLCAIVAFGLDVRKMSASRRNIISEYN